MQKAKRHAKRVGTAIVGSLVLAVGIIAIPYPGPGWLIVFAGLAILATEFTWAQTVLDFAKSKYDAWKEWLEKQSMTVQVIVLVVTGLVVVLTLWLLNVFGMLQDWLNLPYDWLESPFARS
ncbi:MAG TPA: TIGR02611 family protein [Candidatus Saccharimonadales bacterium]|nr:TIGR02611 family protein [Candidatus Saccharimonadales bacterium]